MPSTVKASADARGVTCTCLELDRAGFREWLSENHSSAKECFVFVTTDTGSDALLYLDAVEEALCFGWIDSVKRK